MKLQPNPSPLMPSADGTYWRRGYDGYTEPWNHHRWENGFWACLIRPVSNHMSYWRPSPLGGWGFDAGERITIWDGDHLVATGRVQAVPGDLVPPLLHPPLPRRLPMSAADLGLLAKPDATA